MNEMQYLVRLSPEEYHRPDAVLRARAWLLEQVCQAGTTTPEELAKTHDLTWLEEPERFVGKHGPVYDDLAGVQSYVIALRVRRKL